MNYTENYQLNQWESADKVRREDFNEDNKKLDSAIAGRARMSAGQYNPQGTEVDVPYHVSLGFRPKAVLIWRNSISGYASNLTHCGMLLDGSPLKVPNENILLADIEDDGFFVMRHKYGDFSYYPQLAEWVDYFYLALA